VLYNIITGILFAAFFQCDHLPGKPVNVKLTRSRGIVGGNLVMNKMVIVDLVYVAVTAFIDILG